MEIQGPLMSFGERFIESFQREKVSKFPTDFVELSFLNEEFSLIPMEEFSTDTAQSYVETQMAIDPFLSLRFNPINSKNCVVCFTYNEEIEFFFENKYPFVNIIHNSKRTLDKVPNEVKNTLQLSFHHQFFEMVGIGKEFDFYSNTSFKSIWDVVYAVKKFDAFRERAFEIVLLGETPWDNLEEILRRETSKTVRSISNTENYALIS